MPDETRHITSADIAPHAAYAAIRAERRRAIVALKKARRVDVGPFASFHFENFDTMLAQVQEMLHIEKGGEAQLADELAAYNPLIPQGAELVATMMLEIGDPVRRARTLATLGGIEERCFIDVGGDRIAAVAEDDAERTDENGKTSAVHFLHFPFSSEQIARFADPAVQVAIGIDHPNYAHLGILGAGTRAALAADFA